jgi:hypothetical protein
MPNSRPRFAPLLIALSFLLAGACSGPSALQPGTLSGVPTIDGGLSEWGGSLTYLDEEGMAMGVVPTDSVLYVALSTQDQGLIRSVAKNGLVVWVDPAGGQERTYGVQYPLGLRAQRAAQAGSGARSGRPSSAGRARRNALPFDPLSLKELDVIRHDSTRVRIPAQFSSGVRAQVTINPGAFVYELAVPLGDGAEGHGLRASLGPTVGVGLSTPEADEETDVSVPNRGNIPSVTGRQGRTRRGRRRQRQQARRNQGPDLPTLDLWTTVAMAGT